MSWKSITYCHQLHFPCSPHKIFVTHSGWLSLNQSSNQASLSSCVLTGFHSGDTGQGTSELLPSSGGAEPLWDNNRLLLLRTICNVNCCSQLLFKFIKIKLLARCMAYTYNHSFQEVEIWRVEVRDQPSRKFARPPVSK